MPDFVNQIIDKDFKPYKLLLSFTLNGLSYSLNNYELTYSLSKKYLNSTTDGLFSILKFG